MKRSKMECDLQTCFMCKICLKEWIPAIGSNRKTFEVKKGEKFLEEGEKVTGVYFVFDGVIKVHKKWGDKELIVRFANKGAIIGHRGLGTHSNVYPISATALESSTVCFIPLEFFTSSLKVNNEFTYNLMLFFADELQESERKMRNQVHLSVKGRVAQSIINLKNQFGMTDDGDLIFSLTRQDLASYAGATYETVFRMMNELKEEKSLDVIGKGIRILDLEKLTSHTKQI